MQHLQTAPRVDTVGAGLPGDRSARIAADHAFADLKRTFLYVLEGSSSTDSLRQQVEQAEEPVDLWLLRASAFAALDGVGLDQRGRRQLLRRGLGTLFPEVEVQGACWAP